MPHSTLIPDSFDILLRGFDEIIKDYPSIHKASKELDELKEAAQLDNKLTFWQKDAIIQRCNNYQKGQYGEQVKRVDNRSDYSKSLK